MKEKIKEYKLDNTVIAVVSIVVGIILTIFPGATLRTIGRLISAALFIMGAVSIVTYLRRSSEENFMRNDFLRGLVEITLGVCTLIKADLIISILPVVLGIVVIISGCKKLQETIDMIKSKSKSWISFMVISAINIGLGVLIVCNPFKTAKTLIMMIGIGLVFGGVMDFIITQIIAKKIEKGSSESDDNIIDM